MAKRTYRQAKKGMNPAVLGVIALVVLVGLGVGGYFLYKHLDSDSNNNNNNNANNINKNMNANLTANNNNANNNNNNANNNVGACVLTDEDRDFIRGVYSDHQANPQFPNEPTRGEINDLYNAEFKNTGKLSTMTKTEFIIIMQNLFRAPNGHRFYLMLKNKFECERLNELKPDLAAMIA